MSTISTAAIKAGISSIGNLKCCRCCRVHTLVPHCIVFTSTSDGAWDCSPVSSPPSPPSPPYYTYTRYNANLGPGAAAPAAYCPGDSSRYNDARMVLASNAVGNPFFTELIGWNAHIHYDATVDSCVIDCVHTLTCKDYLTGAYKTYVEYRGTLTLPKLCTGEFDFAGGLTVPMNLYDYVVLDGSAPETQPPILYVTIYPGLCSSMTTSATVAGVPVPQRTEYCKSIRLPLNTNAGCGGFGCKQTCQSTDPEVIEFLSGLDVVIPADECQRCPGYQIPQPKAN